MHIELPNNPWPPDTSSLILQGQQTTAQLQATWYGITVCTMMYSTDPDAVSDSHLSGLEVGAIVTGSRCKADILVEAGETYYWRVFSTTAIGPIWSFKVYPPDEPVEPEEPDEPEDPDAPVEPEEPEEPDEPEDPDAPVEPEEPLPTTREPEEPPLQEGVPIDFLHIDTKEIISNIMTLPSKCLMRINPSEGPLGQTEELTFIAEAGLGVTFSGDLTFTTIKNTCALELSGSASAGTEVLLNPVGSETFLKSFREQCIIIS